LDTLHRQGILCLVEGNSVEENFKFPETKRKKSFPSLIVGIAGMQ